MILKYILCAAAAYLLGSISTGVLHIGCAGAAGCSMTMCGSTAAAAPAQPICCAPTA